MLTVHYGGTFDPIHNGHLAIARSARDVLQAPVALLPAADPPHRPAPGASAAQRARMLELAIQGEPGLGVDLRELRRAGPSYTVDTLQELRDEHGPEAPLAWLIGEDSLRGLDRWHHWTRLFDLAHLVVAARAGTGLETALPEVVAQALAIRRVDSVAALVQAPAGAILLLEQPLRPESATAVRALRMAGDPAWRACVPGPVAAFIDAEGLYLDTASTPGPI